MAELIAFANKSLVEELTAVADLIGTDPADDMTLDFGAVSRLSTKGVLALKQVADNFEPQGTALALKNVSVDVYRVLKLAGLADRLHFPTGE
jgi:anti-anti-sigma regulatory factor